MQRNKSAGTTRRVLTATAISAAVTGISLISGGTAAASTVLPENPQKSCTSTVHGVTGDTIAITGNSVADLVDKGADRAKKILLISELSIWDKHLSGVVADAGMIPIGTVPDSGTSTISGETIATAVVKLIEGEPGLGFDPDKTLGIIEDTVAKNCELTVVANDDSAPTSAAAAPTQRGGTAGDTAGAPAAGSSSAPATAGGSGPPAAETNAQLGTGNAMAPRRDYSGIPAVPAPSAGISVPPDLRYPPKASLPQQAPGFDILGEGKRATAPGNNKQPTVREAGNADALAAPAGPERVQLPMLLAVVALAMVTAALVRTWVLRRTT